MGHVWTAPGWQELSSRVQQWSEQPCVRPVSAVHVTAGHNALRGSGPGQKLAFTAIEVYREAEDVSSPPQRRTSSRLAALHGRRRTWVIFSHCAPSPMTAAYS